MTKNSTWSIFFRDIIKNNPIFCLFLGLCPTLAVTTSVDNALGMGVSTLFVLFCSNIMISSIRNFVPKRVRIPCFIMIIATFVTIISLLMEAYFPSIHSALGIYLPLIVVNCIVLGRAESFASKNRVYFSMIDGLGIGIGFIFSLILIGLFREFLGTGKIALFGTELISTGAIHFRIFAEPAGALLIVGLFIAFFRKLKEGL